MKVLSRLICGRPQSSAPQSPGRVSVRVQWSDGQFSGRAKISSMVRCTLIGRTTRGATRAAHIRLNTVDHDGTKLCFDDLNHS